MHDRNEAFVVQLFERCHRRMQTNARILIKLKRDGVACSTRRLHGDLWSCVEVGRIAVRDDGVEAVVAAAELNDDKNAVIRNSRVRTQQRIAEDTKRAALDEARHRRRERRKCAAALQEESTSEWGVLHGRMSTLQHS